MRARRRSLSAWHAEPLERRVLLDAAATLAPATLAAVPVMWTASDTSMLSGDLNQAGETHLYRFTTAEPARLSLKAHARDAAPLEGRVKLMAVTNPQSDAHVVAADELSVGHAAAVDGWIAPGEYLIAVTADGVVADGTAADEAVDEALGKYDLALQLDRAEANTSSWAYSDAGTVTYRYNSVGQEQNAVVPFASSAANDSFFAESAPAVSVLVNSPTGSFVVNRTAETLSGGQQAPPSSPPPVTTPSPPPVVSPPSSSPSASPPSAAPTLSASPAASPSTAAASAVSRSSADFPAAAAPVSRPTGPGAAASLSNSPRGDRASSVATLATAPSGLSGSADGSDSSQEGELEYAFRRASDVLAKAIGGTLRDARDAALLGLSEVIQFDLVPGDDEADWIADALDALLPAIPGGAIFDAALERLNPQPTIPVSKPAEAPGADTSAENLPPANASSATAAFAALIVAFRAPSGRKERVWRGALPSRD